MQQSSRKKILDPSAINRSIIRLAHEILERNNVVDEIILIGILTRGEPLAKRLQSHIKKISGFKIPIGTLDITFHRDDFRERFVVPQVQGTSIDDDINDKTLILVLPGVGTICLENAGNENSIISSLSRIPPSTINPPIPFNLAA